MITNLSSQRSGLPLMIVAGAVLVAEIVLLAIFGRGVPTLGTKDPSVQSQDAGAATAVEERREDPSGAQPEVAQQPEADRRPEEASAGEPVSKPLQDSAAPSIVDVHRVRRGDNLFALSLSLWRDGRLWPFLYHANQGDLGDPDLLSIGARLAVPDMTGAPVAYARENHPLAAAAHLAAYRAYRDTGERLVAEGIERRNSAAVRLGRNKVEKARWVLYAAGWFVPGFPAGYADAITSEDLKILSSYIERFGPPFGDP